MSLLLAQLTSGTVVATGTGQATWTGLAPTIVTPVTLLPGVGQATWTGLAPTVTVAVVVAPGVGQATWTGLAPTVLTPRTLTPGVGLATWTGLAPTIQISVVIAPGVGQATWVGLAPTVVTSNNITVTPGVGQAVWSGLAPTLTGIVVNVAVAVGGRPRAQPPAKRVRVKGHPQYMQMAEDVVCIPGVGKARWNGFRPTVEITNVDAEERMLLGLAIDDEDLALALALADQWMN